MQDTILVMLTIAIAIIIARLVSCRLNLATEIHAQANNAVADRPMRLQDRYPGAIIIA